MRTATLHRWLQKPAAPAVVVAALGSDRAVQGAGDDGPAQCDGAQCGAATDEELQQRAVKDCTRRVFYKVLMWTEADQREARARAMANMVAPPPGKQRRRLNAAESTTLETLFRSLRDQEGKPCFEDCCIFLGITMVGRGLGCTTLSMRTRRT